MKEDVERRHRRVAGGEGFQGVMVPSRAHALLSLHSGVLGEIEVKFSHCSSKRRQRSLAKYKEHSDITCQVILLFTMMEGQ